MTQGKSDELSLPTLAGRLKSASEQLACVTETPRLDAEILLAHSLGITRAKLLAELSERCETPGFEELLERRLNFEPIAYILGEWEFFSLSFKVVPPLLVPRPETEHLVEVVLESLPDTSSRILEIGTGTGCVAVSIAKNRASCSVTATDINPIALETATENAARHRVADRVSFLQSDLFSELGSIKEKFDVICSNPPYVEEGAWPELPPVIRLHEDPRALLAGADGLDMIRSIARGSKSFLKPGGMLALEIGAGQSEAVANILKIQGYTSVDFHRDLAGIDRIAYAQAS